MGMLASGGVHHGGFSELFRVGVDSLPSTQLLVRYL